MKGIGGSMKDWMRKSAESNPAAPPPPPLVPVERPEWLLNLTRENQNPEIVGTVCEKVRQILTSSEEILYIAVQEKPLVNLFPDCAVLTNRRFIVYRQKLLGRADFEDYIWRELRDAQLKENLVGSTLSMLTTGNQRLTLDYLPKLQARALYRFAQEMEEKMVEERRQRSMEESRAAAGGVFVQNNIPQIAPAAAPIPVVN